jgi:hypothetical protein
MKKLILIIALAASCFTSNAQSDEARQLLLNVEKLAQFKKILKNMKDAYVIITKGYTAVRDISKGNFTLHKTFLDALWEVSPSVKKYKRIADIIGYQRRIVKEYRGAYNRFKTDKQFTPQEIKYIGQVYEVLLDETLKNTEELVLVITSGGLRMSDDERLQAIDRVYAGVIEQYSFLKDFTHSTAVLSLQRKSEHAEVEFSKIIRGIKQ